MAADSTEILTAQQRLALSRRALMQQLRGDEDKPLAGKSSQKKAGVVSSLLSRSAYGGAVQNLIERWWSRHPANAVSQLARPVLERYAQQQPVKLMAASAGIGALIFLVKPWRLLSVTALLAAALKTSDIADMVTTLMKRPDQK
jgi:hypothetical protein